MKEQYRILSDLKAIEEKIFRLQREAEGLPKELQNLDQTLQTARQKKEETLKIQEQAEKRLRMAELDLKEREENLKKSQDKMMEVTSNDAYKAAMREIGNQKTEKSVYEECVIKLMTEADEGRKAAALVSAEFSGAEVAVNTEKVKIEEERKRVLQLLEEQISRRMATIKMLAPEVAELYNRTLAKLRSIPIVTAESGRCSGCHMVIRPQLYNEILGFKAIHKCTTCGRLLVLPPTQPSLQE